MEASPEVAWRAPDLLAAFEAISTASEMVSMASDKLDRGDYFDAFHKARDAMRVAASALLFRDGLVAQTLEATTQYMEDKHPEIPLKGWRSVENTVTGEGPGLLNMIVGALRKETTEKDARYALDVAKDFVNRINELVNV